MGVSSSPPGPMALQRSSGDLDDAGQYYIYASTSGKQPGVDIKILEKGTLTDKFVGTLNKDQEIILAAAPTAETPTASLSDNDQTKQWFRKIDPAADGSVTLDTGLTKIDSFLVSLSAQWPLTFNSTAEVLLFTFGPAAGLVDDGTGAKIPPPGVDAQGLMLTYGLDFAKTPAIEKATIRDLFTYAGVAEVLDNLPTLLPALSVTLRKPDKTGQRNALWLVPSVSMETTVRLQFQIGDLQSLQGLFADALPGFNLTSADAICKKKVLLAETEDGDVAMDQGSMALSLKCTVQASGGDPVPLEAGLEFSAGGMALTVNFPSDGSFTGMIKWLASLIGDSTLESFVNDVLGKSENGKKVVSGFWMRSIYVLFDLNDTDSLSIKSVAFDIEIAANFGGGTTSSPPIFLISYYWDAFVGGSGMLSGQLWNVFTPSDNLDLLPYEESWTSLQPVTQTPAKTIQLVDLIPGATLDTIPDTLPAQISRAYVSFSSTSFAIGGSVTANPQVPGSIPQPYLGEVAFDASFDWGQGIAFVLHVSITAGIEPSADAVNKTPAILVGSLDYDSRDKKWELKATLTGLYASTLLEFFESDDQKHVGAFLNTIATDTMSVTYTYTPKGEGQSTGSSFTIAGGLLIANLRLDLKFDYDSKGWQFTAALNPQQQNATIGEVLEGLLGSTDDIELPDFVSNMVLVGDNAKVFGLNIQKQDTSFQFMAELNIGNLSVVFAQLHSSDWGANKPSKRLIQVAIDGFPNLTVDIPLIGTLQQPLDELYFLWAQDRGALPGKVGGFDRKDLAQINTGLTDKILVKDTIKDDQRKDGDMMIAAGCHFCVIIKDAMGGRFCLLDYAFMTPKPASSSQAIAAPDSLAEPKAIKAGNDEDGGPTAQAPYKKTAGPLSINNVGLKYKNKKLAIMFDATFEMGPIGFTLIGFSLNFEFTTLEKVPLPTPNLDGLSAAFEKPPLTLAGIIRHGNDGQLDYYAGGLVVGWTVYQFQAAGFYGKVTTVGYDPYTSVFVFAKLNGPLVTLEFAEISGVCGGFGYNSSVRVPTINEIYEFPFIASADLGNAKNALEALRKLTDPGPAGWFKPLDKTYWGAVGMKVDAFKMLSFDAVLVVQFGQAIKVGLFALVIADVPTAASPVKLAHVELGLSAVADFQYGTLRIEAQLSPRSFILDPSCHLTGGMGLYYWFDAPEADKANVGNFVFTLGGYHQAFLVPVGFPNPPRLGISWSLGSTLSISGQAYFAITPKACMAGGRLHASFSAGPIGAWFDAFADFLINYKPFHFTAAAGISVGVKFEAKILFIHIKISIEIGAQLYLWGPPVAGRVHVDLWIVSFDINFGDSERDIPGIPLSEFYDLVLQASQQSQAATTSAMLALTSGLAAPEEEEAAEAAEDEKVGLLLDKRPMNEGHNFLPVSGLLNDNDQPKRDPNDPWIVRAGTFSLVVACKMAINAFKKEADGEDILTYQNPFSKPMKLTSPMDSVLVVKVQQDGAPKPDDDWQYEIYTKDVPRALWDKYDPSQDPTGGKNNIGDLLNGDKTSLKLMMGIQMTAPKASMAKDPFPEFDVAKADLQPIWSERPFPTFANSDPAFAPAKPYEGDDVSKQYEGVYSTWTSPGWGTGDQGQAGFVKILAAALKWTSGDQLSGIAGLPARLGVKDTWMNSYIAAPMISV